MIAFLVQHDAYHIGQVAFLRRQLGRPAMAHTRSACSAASPAAVKWTDGVCPGAS